MLHKQCDLGHPLRKLGEPISFDFEEALWPVLQRAEVVKPLRLTVLVGLVPSADTPAKVESFLEGGVNITIDHNNACFLQIVLPFDVVGECTRKPAFITHETTGASERRAAGYLEVLRRRKGYRPGS